MLYATVSQPQPWFLILIGTLWSCLVLNTDALQIFSKGHPLYMGLVGNLKSTSCFPEKALISETYMYPQLSNQKSPKFQNHTCVLQNRDGEPWAWGLPKAQQLEEVRFSMRAIVQGLPPNLTRSVSTRCHCDIICSTEQFYENTVASRQEVVRSLWGMGRQVIFYPHSLNKFDTCPILFLSVLK